MLHIKQKQQSDKKKEWSTTQVIAFSFLLALMTGTFLLCLPISTADGQTTSFIDAFFTATTSVCVTGLVTVNTFEHWSLFGQIVILILIQFGGLGIITFTTSFMLLIGKRVTLKGRMLIEDAFNLSTLSGLVRFLKKVLAGTLLVEAVGALGYMVVFVPQFGPRGIWISIFNAVSAFCNAGMDIIGPNSLMDYSGNVWINLVTICLIIISGLGFIVWFDLLRVRRMIRQGDIPWKCFFDKLHLHTKIVLTTTVVLLIGGTVLVFALEYNNPATIGEMSLGHKLMASFFQSVTTRTAGFATIAQDGLHQSTALVCIVLMFVGGSPVGTAGGVKTTTVALVFLTAVATVVGREQVTAYRRTIPLRTVRKAVAVALIFLGALFVAIILMSTVTTGSFMDIAYETASAIGTVGLSRNLTSTLTLAGKLIIITCMYLGRIGPLSLAIAFGYRQGKKTLVTYSKEDITVG